MRETEHRWRFLFGNTSRGLLVPHRLCQSPSHTVKHAQDYRFVKNTSSCLPRSACWRKNSNRGRSEIEPHEISILNSSKVDKQGGRENKTTAAFIAENTKLTRLPNKP
ncbi:hypothetical protein CapIbe_009573 [Capra ibex]